MLPQPSKPTTPKEPVEQINLDQIEAENAVIASYVNKIDLLVRAGKQLHADNVVLVKQLAEAKAIIERQAMEKMANDSATDKP